MLGYSDEVLPTKTLKDYLQKAKLGEIKGGFIGQQVLSQQDVLTLAELPPLDELRGKLLGVINSPLAGLVMSFKWSATGFGHCFRTICQNQRNPSIITFTHSQMLHS